MRVTILVYTRTASTCSPPGFLGFFLEFFLFVFLDL